MKCSVHTIILKKTLALLAKVIDPSQPVFSAVQIGVKPKKDGTKSVELRSVDPNVDVRFLLDGDADFEDGFAAVDCRNLLKLARKSKAESIELEYEDPGKLIVRSGRAKYTMPTILETPEWLDHEYTHGAMVPYDGFMRIVKQSNHAVSGEYDRPHLAAMLFEFEDDGTQLFARATDGHRFAMASSNVFDEIGLEVNGSALVKAESIHFLSALFKGFCKADECCFSFGKTHAALQLAFNGSSVDQVMVRMKLAEATFPPYKKVMPSAAPESRYTIISNDLLEAVEAVTVFGTSKAVRIHPGETDIRIANDNPDAGDAEQTIDAEQKGGVPFDVIRINPNYLQQTLKDWGETQVVLEFWNNTDAMVLRGQDTNPYAIIMPCRL